MSTAKKVDVKILLSEERQHELQASGLTLMEAYGLWLWHKDNKSLEDKTFEEVVSSNNMDTATREQCIN